MTVTYWIPKVDENGAYNSVHGIPFIRGVTAAMMPHAIVMRDTDGQYALLADNWAQSGKLGPKGERESWMLTPSNVHELQDSADLFEALYSQTLSYDCAREDPARIAAQEPLYRIQKIRALELRLLQGMQADGPQELSDIVRGRKVAQQLADNMLRVRGPPVRQ